jgi:signal transduction histidine kinase
VPLRDAQGRARGCVGAFLDITPRKRSEGLLAGEKRVLEWIAGRKPLPEVLQEICRCIEALSPDVLSSILLADPDGSHLRPVAGPNLPEEWSCAINPLPIGPSVGTCGAAAWGKEQVVASDIATDPRWTGYPEQLALALKCGLRACWSTPILAADGALLGTFALYYREPRSPRAADLALIRQLSHLASVAIEHDRAAEALRRARDELEERVRERTAELAAANQELDAFAGAVSHDLRAPLRGLSGFSQILTNRSRDKLDEQSRFCLDHLQAETRRMDQLIDAMLQFSRARRSEVRRETVNLSQLAREIEADLRRDQPDRRVQFTVTPDLVAQGDPVLLRSALRNLLGNAWKFIAQSPEARIELGRVEKDGQAVYSVSDNGAGFDMQSAPRLFVPFQRLHSASEFPGTGVGLATVQQIIRRHGGAIWAESTVGKGATFCFTLP